VRAQLTRGLQRFDEGAQLLLVDTVVAAVLGAGQRVQGTQTLHALLLLRPMTADVAEHAAQRQERVGGRCARLVEDDRLGDRRGELVEYCALGADVLVHRGAGDTRFLGQDVQAEAVGSALPSEAAGRLDDARPRSSDQFATRGTHILFPYPLPPGEETDPLAVCSDERLDPTEIGCPRRL
jgi:hypothetical protein